MSTAGVNTICGSNGFVTLCNQADLCLVQSADMLGALAFRACLESVMKPAVSICSIWLARSQLSQSWTSYVAEAHASRENRPMPTRSRPQKCEPSTTRPWPTEPCYRRRSASSDILPISAWHPLMPSRLTASHVDQLTDFSSSLILLVALQFLCGYAHASSR